MAVQGAQCLCRSWHCVETHQGTAGTVAVLVIVVRDRVTAVVRTVGLTCTSSVMTTGIRAIFVARVTVTGMRGRCQSDPSNANSVELGLLVLVGVVPGDRIARVIRRRTV